MEFFDEAECWSRDHIEQAQLTRLRSTVAQTRKCDFYRQRLDEAGIGPDSIRSLDDLRRIPFTTKQDLRSQYPTGLLCVPQSEIVRMHCSSGTTGSPVAICHTQNDINSWADLMARSIHMVGVRRDDVFQNMSGYGLFTGGLGIHFGAERLGCMTIPAGAGNSRRQIKLAKDFRTTVAHILPSYALILGEHLRSMGEDPREFPLRIALVGAEPYTEEFRRRIEDLFDMKAYNSYGLSEMNGPGVGFECTHQSGMHLWEDAYIPEIVDPETGEPMPEGEVGELVMTCLCRQGMPILRYRTRDLTRFIPGECACGRKHRRIDRILGRADDMFIIKGVNVYPMQIEQVIMTFAEVGQSYLILLENDGLGDVMRVQIEIRDEHFVEDMRVLQSLQKAIASRLRDEILVTPKVELVESNSLPRTEGKAVRLQDLRNKK
ncbi:phenylacetate--CoA ligase [Desulfovibrio desulfuricans]|uniref:Phenylacetate-coenzyme A ligase n=1 Tax=Desulfovibrio desulfuricans TaxID=876 RepID=A0A4P7UJK1_DESDE|nr:phenylacetate--CoA ligase [Desulfovibrio desulfuricans]QCC85867.1 phenylacetate--CoA ligase [Desulfovibrio desulfuricans]